MSAIPGLVARRQAVATKKKIGSLVARLEQRFPRLAREDANQMAIIASRLLHLNGGELVLLMQALQGDVARACDLANRLRGAGALSISPPSQEEAHLGDLYGASIGADVGHALVAAHAVVIAILKSA